MNDKGFKTTEFWLTAISIVASISAMVAGMLPAEYAAIATALSAGLYAAARAYTKAGGTIVGGEPMELRTAEPPTVDEAALTKIVEGILAKRS